MVMLNLRTTRRVPGKVKWRWVYDPGAGGEDPAYEVPKAQDTGSRQGEERLRSGLGVPPHWGLAAEKAPAKHPAQAWPVRCPKEEGAAQREGGNRCVDAGGRSSGVRRGGGLTITCGHMKSSGTWTGCCSGMEETRGEEGAPGAGCEGQRDFPPRPWFMLHTRPEWHWSGEGQG